MTYIGFRGNRTYRKSSITENSRDEANGPNSKGRRTNRETPSSKSYTAHSRSKYLHGKGQTRHRERKGGRTKGGHRTSGKRRTTQYYKGGRHATWTTGSRTKTRRPTETRWTAHNGYWNSLTRWQSLNTRSSRHEAKKGTGRKPSYWRCQKSRTYGKDGPIHTENAKKTNRNSGYGS